MATSCGLFADAVPVLYKEGTVHVFLILRAQSGKILAGGDLVQLVRGDRVTSRLVFRFRDGSLDDETSVFTQSGSFRLVRDHHIQRGRTFERPTDISIDVPRGEVRARVTVNGEQKSDSEQLDLPLDLANGMILNILKNIRPDVPQTVLSYLIATPKPRIVKLSVATKGEDDSFAAGVKHAATHFVVKVELGGITGLVAPLIGKQPASTDVWMVEQGVPAFVRSEGPLFVGGPIWRLELTSPVLAAAPIATR